MLESKASHNVVRLNPFIFLLVAAVVFMLIGGLTMFSVVHDEPAPPTMSAPTAAPFLEGGPTNDQIAILILVVNDHAAAQPELEGCWVLTFRPDLNQYFFLGFSPETPVDPTYTLLSYYNARPDLTLEDRTRFMEEGLKIVSEGGLMIRYRLLLDHAGLAAMVDLVGGLSLDAGQPPLSGAELLARYAALPPDATLQRLEFQQHSLEVFGQALQRQPWTPETLRVLYDHFQSYSPDAAELLELALRAAPLAQADISIRVSDLPPQ